jgi:hypothetical protein
MSWTTVANSSLRSNKTLPADIGVNNSRPFERSFENTNDYTEENDEDYETDEDSYEELDITAWGDNKKEAVGWHTLVDPSVKMKAGGIGSGDLHRRGDNFKPVSEQFILNQRMKKSVPTASSGAKKKKKKKRNKNSVAAAPASKPVLVAGYRNKPYVPMKFTTVTQRTPIKDPKATTWGQLPLSSTPFWEEKNAKKEEQVKPLQQSQNQLPRTQSQSHQKQPQFQQHPSQPKQEQSKKSKQQPLPLESPQQTSSPSITNNGWNPEVPSFIPSTSTSTSSSSIKTLSYNAEAPPFVPLYQQPVKKPVKISSPTPTSTSTSTSSGTNNTSAATPKSSTHIVDTSILRRHLAAKPFHPATKPKLESQTGPESTRGLEEPVPLLQFNLELAPGVTAMIRAYQDSKPSDIVEQFAQKHQLNMTNTAKENIGKTIKLLIEKKIQALDYQQQRQQHHQQQQ